MDVVEKGRSPYSISAGCIERGECFEYEDEIYMVSTSRGSPIYVRLSNGGNHGGIGEHTSVVPVTCKVLWEHK